MADIFISYKRERLRAAKYLAEILRANGYTVWFDQHVTPGLDFRRRIRRELGGSKAVIVLWCSLSVASQEVLDEARIAATQGKIIPVRIENVQPPADGRPLQYLDIIDWDGDPGSDHLDGVFRSVAGRVGRYANGSQYRLRKLREGWRIHGSRSLKDIIALPVEDVADGRVRRGSLRLAGYAFATVALVAAALIGWKILLAIGKGEKSLGPGAIAVDGRWVAGEGGDCRYAMRIETDGAWLKIAAADVRPRRMRIQSRTEEAIITADGTFVRSGERLRMQAADGSAIELIRCES